MYVNGKNVPGQGEGGIKENSGRGVFKYDIL
jgi:hypothetical protein